MFTQVHGGVGEPSIGLAATELLVEGHGVLGVTSLKDVAAIVVGNIHIHRTFLLEARNLMRQCLLLMSTTVSSLCCNCLGEFSIEDVNDIEEELRDDKPAPRGHTK